MNCPECERLFDAYLDAQMSGSLRLEFDAHRVHCARCQQKLAWMESIESVVSSDAPPALSADFADRVLDRALAAPRRQPVLRVAFIAGAVVQVAAALGFAVLARHWWFAPRPVQPTVAASVPEEMAATDEFRAVRQVVVERIGDRLWAMHDAGRLLSSDVSDLARYLNVVLPEDVARESVRLGASNPWQGLWDALLAPSAAPAEEPSGSGGIYSL